MELDGTISALLSCEFSTVIIKKISGWQYNFTPYCSLPLLEKHPTYLLYFDNTYFKAFFSKTVQVYCYLWYVNEDKIWLVVLAATTFVIYSTTTMLKSYNEGKLMFDLDMIPLIKDEVELEITYQQKWSKIHIYYPVK